MKIGILTQPLHNNYGGILQAFALQKVLKDLGHEVWTVDRQEKNKGYDVFIKIRSTVYRMIARYVFRSKIIVRAWLTEKELETIQVHTRKFVHDNIRTTARIDSKEKLSLLEAYDFDAYIVGSDQVWRPKYSPCLSNFFLDFLSTESKTKRIAYAASFGTSEWEFTHAETVHCAMLAKKFHAISVREDAAVKLCNEKFGVDALHVLDPTLLLEKEEYVKLVNAAKQPKSAGNLMVYVLDKSPQNDEIIKNVAETLCLKPFTVMPPCKFSEVGSKHLKDCIFPPVTAWLRGFMDAEFVVTDSFHGTAFSILFNKPFISIANQERGVERFNSLLKIFNLENRLFLTPKNFDTTTLYESINWEKVNVILKQNQFQAFRFLEKTLRDDSTKSTS